MYRRALFIPLVLLVILVANAHFGEANETLQAAQDRILSLIQAGDFVAANAAIEKMKADFAGSPELPEQLYQIADKYEELTYKYDEKYDEVEAFEQAKALNAQIAADFPTHEYGVDAALQLAKSEIYELIDACNYESADSAVTQIAVDFADNKDLARRLWEIANRYDKFKAYKYSKAICARIVADYPEDGYAGYAGLQLAKLGVYEFIDSGDYESADLAVSQIISDFAGHKLHSRRLYEIAKRYEHKGGLANAKALYARIAADYPNDKYGSYAAIQLAKLNTYEPIDAGNYEAADSAVSQMKADFNDHSDLPEAIFSVGEEYCKKAYEYKNQGLLAEAEEYFQKALTALGKIITELPASTTTVDAYYLSARCYRQLGEHEKAIEYCQEIVDNWPDYEHAWRVQFSIGNYYERLIYSGLISESEANPKIEQAYQAVIENYPNCRLAKYVAFRLAESALIEEDWGDVIFYNEFLLTKFEAGGEPVVVLYPLALAYDRVGRYEDTLKIYQLFIAKANMTDPRRGEVMQRIKELEAALSKDVSMSVLSDDVLAKIFGGCKWPSYYTDSSSCKSGSETGTCDGMQACTSSSECGGGGYYCFCSEQACHCIDSDYGSCTGTSWSCVSYCPVSLCKCPAGDPHKYCTWQGGPSMPCSGSKPGCQ